MGETPLGRTRPVHLDDQERKTLADAIDVYRTVRSQQHEWMRLPIDQRLSPHDLDVLRGALLEGVELGGEGR